MTHDENQRRYRSGAAARIAKMPTSTLRVWERRYGVASAEKSQSGQRLYSQRDVQRLAMLKALVSAGYAIGTIATLDDDALQTLADSAAESAAAGAVVRTITAIGRGWKIPERRAAAPVTHWILLPDLAQAAGSSSGSADWLIVRESSLHADAARSILEIADRSQASCVAVAYSFGTEFALDVLRMAGVQLFRELGTSLSGDAIVERIDRWSKRTLLGQPRSWGRAPKRYADEQLAAMTARSKVLACECPRHLVELVNRIAAFETYSDGCESRSPQDALLHRYFGDVAGRAREPFEQALSHVAYQEHLAEQSAR